jgi:hypothetical protein
LLAEARWSVYSRAFLLLGGGAGGSAPSVAASSAAIGDRDGSSTTSVNASTTESPALPSDQEIADRIYQGRDRTPTDFYQEPVLPWPTSFSTTHIQNSVVGFAAPAAPPCSG